MTASEPSTIIGHERQREQLLRDIERDNVAHAYLFAGKRHLGKFTVARWFAGEIMTRGQGEREQHQTLRLIRRAMHPDCLVLDQLWIAGVCTDWNVIARSSNVPQQHRAKKDKQMKTDTIGIDDIRALQERLYETPQGGRTCCLIRSIERLHDTAANAFLKILEEPPPSVLFLCTTESAGALPETIVSRMRVMHFSPVAYPVLEPMLPPGAHGEDRALLLATAQGAPGTLMRILGDRDIFCAERQDSIAARQFVETASPLERQQLMREALERDQTASPFLRHVFIRLQRQLRSDDIREMRHSFSVLRSLFPLLHALRTNTNRGLLVARTALVVGN